jgi:hypothetical protein
MHNASAHGILGYIKLMPNLCQSALKPLLCFKTPIRVFTSDSSYRSRSKRVQVRISRDHHRNIGSNPIIPIVLFKLFLLALFDDLH